MDTPKVNIQYTEFHWKKRKIKCLILFRLLLFIEMSQSQTFNSFCVCEYLTIIEQKALIYVVDRKRDRQLLIDCINRVLNLQGI